MSWKRCVTIVVILVVMLCIALSSVYAEQPKTGGILRIAYAQDMTGMDPHTSLGIPAVYVMQNIFQNLITLDENLEFAPELAESWKTTDGGKTYVFHLRRGVQFHDGTPFNAQAVKWNFDRLLDPEEKVRIRSRFSTVEQVEVVDDYTIKIIQKYPSRLLLSALASYSLTGLMIISPASYEKWGRKDLMHHPAGTGPFIFDQWESGRFIRLKRNPNYWKPELPYLDGLEFKIIREEVTRAASLRRKAVDYANRVPAEYVSNVTKDAKVRIFKGQATVMVYGYLNHNRKPFDDLRVRQALLGYGLDRQQLSETVFVGHGAPLLGMAPPGSQGYIDLLEKYPYDPEKAKALLKEAGYDAKKPLELEIVLNPFNAGFAAPLRTQLENLGVVKAKVRIYDHPTFIRSIIKGELDMGVTQSYPFLDIGDRLVILESREIGGVNLANVQDSRLDQLAEAFRRAPELPQWRQTGKDLLEYLADNAVYVSMTTMPAIDAARDYVKGLPFRRHLRIQFETTWLDK